MYYVMYIEKWESNVGYFLLCRRGAGEWLWCFGALPGRNQSICDGHRGLSDAERADDLKPSLRPRQTVQA